MTQDATQIIRDEDGVAHVRAATVAGAFRGQGYAAAEDRLWQMDFDRRRALGVVAAAVGAGGVASDSFHRRMDLAGMARRTFDALGTDTVAMLDAYAGGVNAFLATDPDLPAEFDLLGITPDEWEPWHSIAVYQFRHLAMGTWESKVWRTGILRNLGPEAAARLWPSIPELTIDPDEGVVTVAVDVAAALEDVDTAIATIGEEHASNNLVLAGSRTATGRPFLAGDPHRAIDLPNVYWQNHLTAGGDDGFDVIGLSFPGVPGYPHFGHNDRVAWCITHGMADDQDVYLVRVPDDVTGTRIETIEVAGGEPITIECHTTVRGPIIAGSGSTGLAVAWTALAAPDTTADALLPMLHAGSVDEMDRALAPWVVPVNNLLMADVDGAIAYRMRGRLALRQQDNGWTVVPGDDDSRAWTGFVADGDLPRWRDPASGVLVTANNRISSGGPYVSHDWAHPARATTLTSILTGRDGWTVEAVSDALGDTYSPVAATFRERLCALEPTHPLDTRALALLRDWDARMDAESAAAMVYGGVRAELVGVVADRLGLTRDRLPGIAGPTMHTTMRLLNARLAFWIDDPSLVPDDALASALRMACRRTELAQGPDPSSWRWGAAHTAMWVHPLAAMRPDLASQIRKPPPVSLGGDNECVWATSTAPPSTMASNGQVARYVMDVGDWDGSRWVVPHGVSGDVRSPHHLDQLSAWSSVRLHPMRYSAAAVDAATVSVTVLD